MSNNEKLSNTTCDTTVVLNDSERQKCEIWTRVMGYHRSVTSFNKGKKSEFAERVYFSQSNPEL